MDILPVVRRELQVAARKRSTFWVRIIAAMVALLIATAFLLLSYVYSFSFTPVSLGKGLFATLTWLSLAAALGSGLFLTSDCLSEEKREGTMGFLFLTDLRGYDVVFGKLVAASVRGYFALLAIFPILAVTLLMGGVTGPQFWKTALALINALFVSMACGMLVSALSRDSQKALSGTIALVVAMAGGGPALDAVINLFTSGPNETFFTLLSPCYVFLSAGAWGASHPYWLALLWNQIVAWSFLGIAGLVLRGSWQDKPARSRAATNGWSRWWKFGGIRYRHQLRKSLIDRNPVLWLACRERWQQTVIWILAVVMAAGFLLVMGYFASPIGYAFWSYGSSILQLAIYVAVASQAARFFLEARRGGLMELILGTSMTEQRIVQGQWRSLLRLLGVPLLLVMLVQGWAGYLSQQEVWSQLSAATPAPAAVAGPTTNSSSTAVSSNNNTVATQAVTASVSISSSGPIVIGSDISERWTKALALVISVGSSLIFLADLMAIGWFGMWAGMTSKNANTATLKTFSYVQVIPWFAITIASSILIPLLLFTGKWNWLSGGGAAMMVWYSLFNFALSSALYLGKDVLFIVMSRRKLLRQFRERAGWLTPIERRVNPPAMPPTIPPQLPVH